MVLPGVGVTQSTQRCSRSGGTVTIRFVTPEQWLGPPGGKTKVISDKDLPLASNDILWVGLVGDSQNNIKTVSPDIPGAVAIVEASPIGDTRWFRVSQPHGSECRVQAADSSGRVFTGFHLSFIHLPKGRGRIDFDIGPDGIPVHTAPKARADYIDLRMEGIGYNIYLGGFQVYCTGMNTPIEVPYALVDLNLNEAEAVDATVYDTLAQANDAIQKAPVRAKGPKRIAYYSGAGGVVIAPTVFSPATTPRIIATYYEARRLYADYVIQALSGIAIGIVGGIVLRTFLGRFLRKMSEDPKPPSRPPLLPAPKKIEPVNGTVNVGGGGEIPNVTNLNPIKPGSGGPVRGIPNHVPAPMEKMDEIFVPGSVKEMNSIRLRYMDVDWPTATKAAAKVMPKGGKVQMNVWTRNQQEVDALKAAFERAGFKNVRTDKRFPPGPGTMLEAER